MVAVLTQVLGRFPDQTGGRVDAHPLTLALDVDVVRGMLGRWLDRPHEAGLIARDLALAMARVQLLNGRDVVVPQYLGRVDFVLELEQLARQAGARFVEIVLLSDPAEAVARFARRSADPETPEHRDNSALLERSGGLEALPSRYTRLLDAVSARPGTRSIAVVEGALDAAYQDLLAVLAD